MQNSTIKRVLTPALLLIPLALAACGGSTIKANAAAPVTTAPAPSILNPPSTFTTAAPTTAACQDGALSGDQVCVYGSWRKTVVTTEAPTTTTVPAGSRAHPFDLHDASIILTTDDWSALKFSNLRPVDPLAIHKANQFNDPAPAGQMFMAVTFTGVYRGSDKMSGSQVGFDFSLVGAKSKVYDAAFVSDTKGTLHLLNDQPDVISGGSLTGDIIYLVDANDTSLMVTDGTQFIIPG